MSLEKLLETGHKLVFLNDEETKEVQKYCSNFSKGTLRVHPENILLPSLYEDAADPLYNFKFRPGDVLVQGFAKTGTTWTQEIVWTMLHNPDLDNPNAEEELMIRSPVLEVEAYSTIEEVRMDPNFIEKLQTRFPDISFEKELNWMEVLKATPDRRVMKCHLPPTFFRPQLLDIAKSVYLIRDPRDACLSFYFHSRNLVTFGYKGTLDEYGEAYLNNKTPFGDIANHIRQWLPFKDHKNVHFIFYEDLKLNTMTELKKLNMFLGANLSDHQLEKVMHHTSFEQMKKQKSVFHQTEDDVSGFYVKEEAQESGGFFRKGIVGEYKEKFSPQLKEKFAAYMKKAFEGMNLPYC